VAFLNWSESFSIGVAALDADHRRFFDLLNRLYAGILDGSASNAAAAAVAEEALAFAIEHCAREEAMLAEAGYPGLAEMRRQHGVLRDTIENFRSKLSARMGMSTELANVLMEWVLQHILKEDKKCGAFLNAAGVR